MNKKTRKIIKNKAGLSAVIGVILMVAICIAIAATVYVWVSGIMTDNTDYVNDRIESKINNSVIIHDNYTLISYSYENLYYEMYEIELKIHLDGNAFSVFIDGLLYDNDTDILYYDNNNDLISLK